MVDTSFRQISDENLRVYVKSQIDKGHSLVVIREFLVKENIDPVQVSRVLGDFNSSKLHGFKSDSLPHDNFFVQHKGLFLFGGVLLLFIFGIFLFLGSVEDSYSDEITLSILESDISPVLGLDSDYVTLSNVTYSSKGNVVFFSVDKDVDNGVLSESDLFVYFSNDDESQSLMLPLDDSFDLKNGKFKFDSTYLKNYPGLDFSLYDNAQLVVRPKPKTVDNIDDSIENEVIDNTDVNAVDEINNTVSSNVPSSGGLSGGSSGGSSVDDSAPIVNEEVVVNQSNESIFEEDQSKFNVYFNLDSSLDYSLFGNISSTSFGLLNSAFDFSNYGYINISDLSVFDGLLSELSLSVWVKMDNLTNQGYQGVIFHEGTDDVDSFALYVRPSAMSVGFKTTGTTNSWSEFSGFSDLFDCNWHNLVATYDGSVKSVYLDGNFIDSIDAIGLINESLGTNLLLGVGRNTGQLPFEGMMDEFNLYNYSLNSSDVASLFNSYSYVSNNCSVEPTCSPVAETCNGLDDNCNAIIDDGGDALCSLGYTCQGLSGCVALNDPCPVGKTCYYVSNDGNDSNNGLSIGSSWKTVSKVNAAALSAGNYVFFKRGDEWHETIKITKTGSKTSPITFSSYGDLSKSKPLFNGLKTLSGWVNEGNGIYSASIVAESQTNVVLIDSVQYAMGRWPNTGYNTFESHVGTTSITDTQLSSSPNWVGAEVVIDKANWILDRNPITAHSGGTLTYSATTMGTPFEPNKDGRGYFIQNDLKTLDAYGEWYHDFDNDKFYMYFGSVNPNTKTVQMATLTNLIYMRSANTLNGFVIDDLELIGSTDNAIDFYGWKTEWNTINNVTINFPGQHGIYCNGCTNNIYTNNYIANSTSAGIHLFDNGGDLIENNTVLDSGLVLGLSHNGQSSVGIYYRATITQSWAPKYALIQNNHIDTVTYNGITFGGNGIVVKNNFINNSCQNLTDCGGIYTGGEQYSNKTIEGNIILNTISSQGEGIYLDELSDDNLVKDNIVAYSEHDGLKFHKGHDNTIIGNIFYGNGNGIGFENWVTGVANIHDNDFDDNIVVSNSDSDFAISMVGTSDAFIDVGTFNTNTYVTLSSLTNPFEFWQNSVVRSLMTFSEWNDFYNEDLDSQEILLSSESNILFDYNPSNTNKIVSLTGSYSDVDGNPVSGSITLGPYEGIVLIKE